MTTVNLTRTGLRTYEATNSQGAKLAIGGDQFSPVELLLAAIGACSSIDVDLMTSRRSEPEQFDVEIAATKSSEGGNHLEDVSVTFRLRFPDDEGGRQALERVPQAVRASQTRDCTVSRTVELGTPVDFRVE